VSDNGSAHSGYDFAVPGRTYSRQASNRRALVVHADIRGHGPARRSVDARVAEARGLTEAIELTVVDAHGVRVDKPNAGRLFGRGAVERIAERVTADEIGIVVVDGDLSPVQQRNLENAWNTKVIDRTGLILEIFGARARTKEGRLQVELASLTYQRSRLVRSWTHLERQRGGYGFMGGPGERQIEMDRRIIDDRIARLRHDLGEVRKTRDLHREQRREAPNPVVALVGYTNAGKSTLFNRLSAAEVSQHDMLFATLDPTMRGVRLPGGRDAIVSDTVGFISDLPTQLVAAFRATLEEVLEADVIVHVRDIAHPETEAQKHDVEAVLRDLGVGEAVDAGLIEACNKTDLLDAAEAATLDQHAARTGTMVPCSAESGAGLDELLAAVEQRLSARHRHLALCIPLSDGAALAWLYQRGRVLERRDGETHAHMRVSLDPADASRFQDRHAAHVAAEQ